MFTGIITDVGTVVSRQDAGSLVRMEIACAYPLDSIALGASIACAGVCLTATALRQHGDQTVFCVDASAETRARTTLGAWQAGSRVNLERSLKVGDELGGHIVSGHVDGLADIVQREDSDGTAKFVIRAPLGLTRFIAEKGSVALNGTSLTVNGVDHATFTIMLIPHTLAVTTWGEAKAGDTLNIEVDTMARYAARLAQADAKGY